MDVHSEADLKKWLKQKIKWLETDEEVSEGWIGSTHSCSFYDEAKRRLIALGLLDAIDALGSEPPRVSCVPNETNRDICDVVKRKLESLLSHLNKRKPGRPPDKSVAKRRKNVARLSAQGKKPGEIADELGENVATVRQDRRRIS